jgi:VanZ family protein
MKLNSFRNVDDSEISLEFGLRRLEFGRPLAAQKNSRRLNTPRWLRIASWLAVAAWALAIFILSSLEGPRIHEINVFHIWDKAAHAIAFFAGAVLLALALRWSTEWPWARIVGFSIVAVSLYGVSDEWHQLHTPHRSGGNLDDWLADTLGAIVGALATSFTHAHYQRKNRPAPARA